jgi:hypothetical protein
MATDADEPEAEPAGDCLEQEEHKLDVKV